MSADEDGTGRLRDAWAMASADAAPRPDCPEPAVLWDAARGEAPPGEARRLVQHTAECAACAEAWRLAVEVGRGMVEAPGVEPVAAARTRRPAGPLAWIAMAAAAVAIAVGGAALVGRGREAERPLFRDSERLALRALVPESVPLPRTRCVLRWAGGPAGTRYNVEVATERLEVLDRARDLDRPEYLVPAKALAALPPGARLLWQVELRAPDGSRLTSATFVNRLD
jgi:Putative zinc-finger